MHIGIDGNEANIKNRVGVNTYAYQIIWGLYKINKNLPNPHKITIYLQTKPLTDLPKQDKYLKYKVLSGKGLWILTRLMPHLLLSSNKPDILFTPSHYVPLFSTMPKVMSVMDLGYLESSEQFKKLTFWQLKYWTAISVIISKRIIAISKATKRDLIRHYPSSKNKIEVTLLAHDNTFNTPPKSIEVKRVKQKYGIETDYILYLGTLKPSKNIEGLVSAFSGLADDFKNISLVIAGKKGWMYEQIFQQVKQLGLEKRVIFTGFFEDGDKKALVKGSRLLASPSYWEGFGLHVLEAMALGVPVVISSEGSLPEVGGKAAIYVDPKDPKSIQKGMEKVLNLEKSSYLALVNKVREQAAKFSWKSTSEKTMKIIESAAKS